eukprot:977124-Pyramimonas_sp.AAC.1
MSGVQGLGQAWAAVVPSTALPGNFDEEEECDLMIYKQEHNLLHILDRFIPCATGMEIPDKTMTNILDAYHAYH